MSAWPEVRFEALYALPSSNGLSRPRAERGEGQRMISMGELFAYDLVGDVQMERVRMSEGEKAKFLVEPGDLLFARQSLVAEGAGKCSMVKTVNEPTTFESHLIRVRIDKTNNDPWFYYYFFRLKNNPIKAIVNQCAQAGIRGRELAQIKVPLPPLPVQRVIARRLSAYDELIENNRKRIDLLEKKAALLYKEWFVRRRFPGYDQVKWIDGLPEGWKVERLGDWYSTSSGGTPLRSEPTYFENGKYMWVKTGELLDRFIIDTEEKITEEAIAKSAAKLISPGSLLCSMYAGVGKLGIAAKEMTCSQATCVFNPRSFCTNYYLFFFLKLNKAYLENISFGAAQQNISQEIIRKIKLNIPTEKVIVAFTEKVEGIYRTILNLQEQNALLAKKRDLLLPRLMSGRVTP